ncbi:S-adenosyl-L-methionine-dependent methyltransferase [Mycena indigotica]|uniref:S-adenosyl-L-methionine-dependent methyltransferase n=1 Tax=Mycena indigotica TaxID=2126181 RepID=A0A8H6S788_9AGAR|nr:S-adenosyl-L-methionine-dependent methyltransferase [Mycena indigotica]KAF7293588.1 S-adenosyl-L-methionine-dependent methyltransferase [Mycena indigotica]
MASSNFHFSMLYGGDDRLTATARHQRYLFSKLALKPGMRVLEVGCGVGDACFELLHFMNVSVVGIDLDSDKINAASMRALNGRVGGRAEFRCADLYQLESEFGAGSFDAIYSIESLKHCASFRISYSTLGRLLRPGGMLGIYEWCWTASMNPLDITHIQLAELFEEQTQIGHRSIFDRRIDCATQTVQDTGVLKLAYIEDLANRRSTSAWYAPLERALGQSATVWSSDADGEGAFGDLTRSAAVFIAQAGRLKLFSPMILVVACHL